MSQQDRPPIGPEDMDRRVTSAGQGLSVPLTRRRFLAGAATGAVALGLGLDPILAGAEPRGVVVDVRSPAWRTDQGRVNASVVRRMVDQGLMALVGEATPTAAWKALFGPNDVVGLKFNRISRDYTRANRALVHALAAGLMLAGIRRRGIIVREAHGTSFAGGEPRSGWAGEYRFDSGRTRLSNFLVNQVDALINVPNLKHHPIVGFTGALKNISHANDTIMEGPNRFHGNNCDPYVADIYGLREVRDKVRLHVLNGLKGIFDRGAFPSPYQWFHDGLLLSFDPVALDTVALGLLVEERQKHKLRPLERCGTPPKYIASASERGLGISDPARIEVIQVRL